jgi:hypothetical protein
MNEDNSKLLEIFHLTWPNLTRNVRVVDKMKLKTYNEENEEINEFKL